MRIFVLTIFIFSAIISKAQTYVYVSSQSLNLRSEASTNSSIVKSLSKHNNLVVLDTTNSNWFKVKSDQVDGYVHSDFVKSGYAKIKTIQGGRIGAVCKDGTTSSATGRGACSHHGGVARWRYSQSKRVEIIANQE